jgi:hypothetical protein
MLITNKNFRFISLFLALFLVLTGVTFLQVVSSSPAHADSPSCASSGDCQAISTSVALHQTGKGGGSLGGGGPVIGGGGGVASAPVPRTICDPMDNTLCGVEYLIRSSFQYMGPTWNGVPLADCAVKMINGIQVHPVGFTTVQESDLFFHSPFTANGMVYSVWRTISTVCNYPPDPTNVQTNVRCILSFNANIDRLSNSYAGAAGIGSKSQTVSTLSSLESDPSGCQNSITANFGINIGHSQRDYGWYKATSNVTWANCNFGTITFNGVSTRTGGCQNAGTFLGSVGALTVYCGPAIHAWIQLDWTGKDCYNSGPRCTAPNTSKFNGFMGNVQALRDGNDNTMAWANPIFTAGISNAQNWRTKTDVNAGSTPYTAGVGVNDKANQMFRSSQSFGTWVSGSLPSLQNQKLAFYTSGSSGSPFSMTRNYLFDANFTTVATTITGYNVTTGAISTGSSATTVFLKNNPCGPQTSPAINAVRAIGDVLTH